jgi:hypothetical protein
LFFKTEFKFQGEVCLLSGALLRLRGVLPVPKSKRSTKKSPISKRTAKELFIKRAPKTNQQIIAALKSAARKLGHAPTSNEFTRLSGITINQVRERFSGYRVAVRAAGLTPRQWGLRVETAALLEDWGKAVRQVGGVPSRREYERLGSYWYDCLANRFQAWSQVPAAFSRFVAAGGLAGDWTDVLEKIRCGPIPTRGGCPDLPEKRLASQRSIKKREAARLAHEAHARQSAQPNQALAPQEAQLRQPGIDTANAQLLPPPLHGRKCVTTTMLAVFVAELAPSALQWITGACFPRRTLQGRPLLGAPTRMPGLAYEPVNEMGVMMLFAMLSRQLGFVIESVQAGFPDCEAKLEVEPGRWQHFRIEFEYESRGFKAHGHDPSQCDLIVCWRHNWKSCPPNIQVLELSKIVRSLQIG